jgi:rod shape-determining protein MreD
VFASFVQGPIPRLLLVGIMLMALQQTLFVDLRPAGVTVQIMLALAAATGAATGPQKGALAGFVLGLMYDLRAGTPVGSSSLAMGLGGYVAGYSLSITVDPQWWLAALFTGLGAAVGETAVPVIRAFIGEDQPFGDRWYRVVAVVTAASMILSPVLVPLGRWCVRVKRTDWTKVAPRPTEE